MTSRRFTTRLGLAIASTALAAALLLGFQSPDDGAAALTATRGGSQAIDSTGANPAASPATGGSSNPSPTSKSTKGTAVVDGPVVSTRFGPVQVEVTISGGKIVKLAALQLPSGGHSGRISNQVEPMLASEALTAQSASIDTISGATYTSTAYRRSLQAALDQAGI